MMPPLPISYRSATLADVHVLAELNEQLLEDEQSRWRYTRQQLKARMADFLQGEYKAILFEYGGQILAYALYRYDNPDTIFLRHFLVRREHRRQGVGRECIRLLLSEVLPHINVALDVLIPNERARAFWEAVGFKPYALKMERLIQR